MIIGVGVDVCSIERFEQMLQRRPGIAERLFTPREAGLPTISLASRFAAKEALAKALGSPGGMSWQDSEVVRGDLGEPRFRVQGTVKAVLDRVGGDTIHLSISHDAGVACAFVIVEKR